MLYQSIKDGNRRLVWCMPTGAGKSTVCSRFVKACVKNQKRVLFFVHSKELVQQFALRLSGQFHISSGIIMAGVTPNRSKLVQVASVQTLVRREAPPADVVIIDETHRAKANTYRKVIEQYPDAIIIGLTATPFRGDGKGLSDIFETIVHPVKIGELINKGYLVSTKVFAPKDRVNLEGIKTVRGDYDQKELFYRFHDEGLVRGVVENYKKHADGTKAIVFNVNIEHSKEVAERFNQEGIPCAHLDGETNKAERDRIVKAFSRGAIQVLCNVGLFTEGFDVPDTETVILNRATKSFGLYVQMVGRGLRPAPGKEYCIVLDHGDNTIRHGFVEDYDQVPFSLEGVEKKRKEDDEPKTKVCEVCDTINSRFAPVCKCCGRAFPRKERVIRFTDGTEFVALDREALILERLLNIPHSKSERIPFPQLRIYAALRGYKNGWWFHRAIDDGHVDVMKEDPDAFRKVQFLIKLAEEEAGTYGLLQQIRAAAHEAKVV